MARSRFPPPTRPSSPPSAMFSRAWPRRARRAASGYGFCSERAHIPSADADQGAEIRWVEASAYTAIHHVLTNPAYAGSLRLWQIPSGDDAGCIGRPQKARPKNCLAPSGRCLFRTIIRASSIGGPMRPTRIASPRTPAPDRTKRAAP